MTNFQTMKVWSAVLLLTVPVLCFPSGDSDEAGVKKVEDIWHPIDALAVSDQFSSQRSEALDQPSEFDGGDDKVQSRSASVDTSEDEEEEDDDDEDEGEDDLLREASSSPLESGDYYYDYEYPIDEDYDAENDTKPEENDEPQSSTVSRAKRHTSQLPKGESISSVSLQQRDEDELKKLDRLGDGWQIPVKEQDKRTSWQYLNLPSRRQERRRQLLSSPLSRSHQQPTKLIIRQRLQPGPTLAGDSNQLGYRLQALLGGRAAAASKGYSPSQQASRQISATLNPLPSRRHSRFSADSSKTDAAKVLYTLAFLSKLQGQQRGSSAQSTLYGTRFTSSSSASLNRPLQIQGSSGGFSQLSEIRGQPAQSTSRLAIVRLIQPLIRYVAVQKDSSPSQFQSFVQKLSSQESSAGYQTLIRQIQSESLKQQRFRQRLAFWRRLAQRLQRSQQEFPCVSK